MKCWNLSRLALVVTCVISPALVWADLAPEVAALRQTWDNVNFTMKKDDQVKPLEALIEKAAAFNAAHQGNADGLIWEGIIHATYAGAKGGLGALGECKQAKALFEQAISIDPHAQQGAAYTSLGSLYYQVPSWPIAFGDNNKAREYLLKGLELNPDGIDANYFYGDFLFKTGDLSGAEKSLKKALQAPPRPGREGADEGRKKEINELLKKISDKKNK